MIDLFRSIARVVIQDNDAKLKLAFTFKNQVPVRFFIFKIEIIGELKTLPDFKLPPLGGEAIMGNEAIQEMMRTRTLLKPQANPDLCTACGTCVDQCPVSALSMNEEIPEVVPVASHDQDVL